MLIVLLFFYCITGTVTGHTCIEEHIVFNYYQLHSKKHQRNRYKKINTNKNPTTGDNLQNISIGKGLNNSIYPFAFLFLRSLKIFNIML